MQKEKSMAKSTSSSYSFLRQGKVRDVYASEDERQLLIVASDRISAFDHVLPNAIPGKGAILTHHSDTKSKFGMIDGELVLIDELLTPDSSRFWPADRYWPGGSPPSFDKQFVRDYLESVQWAKQPPVPELPEDVVKKTAQKYEEALRRLTKAG
jgi:phosphoribosylaminoimidazole-succinocarboxamide synthase